MRQPPALVNVRRQSFASEPRLELAMNGDSILDTFQDFLIAEHMKPRKHILEISISSLNHTNVRPTKTPKLADKKCAQFY